MSWMTDDAPRLLLLDDDEDVGLAAQLLLQRRVGPLRRITRPAELLLHIAQWRPALLLLDLNFGPGRSDGSQGLRLLREVLALPQPPRVLAMTAYADIPLAVQAVKLGAFDFVVKPWDNARLVALCQDAVRSAAARSARPPGPASEARSGPLPAAPADPLEPSDPVDAPGSLAAQERAALMRAVHVANGNLSAAARELGLSRAALYRRLDKHGL